MRAALFACFKHRHGLRAQIDDAAKGFALPHGPGHGHAGHAQLAFNLIQNIQRLAYFAVHLVHKSDDGRIALAADFNQTAGLGFYTVGRVNHHQGAIHRREHAVGVFTEVFVPGRIKQVNHMLAVEHLHHARSHRDAALLFNLHPVAGGVAAGFAPFDCACNLNCARKQQQFFSQRGFTRVGVADDGKGTAAAGFRGVGHGFFQCGNKA